MRRLRTGDAAIAFLLGALLLDFVPVLHHARPLELLSCGGIWPEPPRFGWRHEGRRAEHRRALGRRLAPPTRAHLLSGGPRGAEVDPPLLGVSVSGAANRFVVIAYTFRVEKVLGVEAHSIVSFFFPAQNRPPLLVVSVSGAANRFLVIGGAVRVGTVLGVGGPFDRLKSSNSSSY